MTMDSSNNNSEEKDMQYKISIDGFNLNDILKDKFIERMEKDFESFESLFLGLVIGDAKKENVIIFKRWGDIFEIESYNEENINTLKSLIDSFKKEE